MKRVLENLKRPYGRDDDPARGKWRLLMTDLTSTTFPDGKSRTPSKLALEATPDGFRVTLTDLNLSVQYWGTCAHLAEVFATLEKVLDGRTGGYKQVNYGDGARKRRDAERKALDEQGNVWDNRIKGGGRKKGHN